MNSSSFIVLIKVEQVTVNLFFDTYKEKKEIGVNEMKMNDAEMNMR